MYCQQPRYLGHNEIPVTIDLYGWAVENYVHNDLIYGVIGTEGQHHTGSTDTANGINIASFFFFFFFFSRNKVADELVFCLFIKRPNNFQNDRQPTYWIPFLKEANLFATFRTCYCNRCLGACPDRLKCCIPALMHKRTNKRAIQWVLLYSEFRPVWTMN